MLKLVISFMFQVSIVHVEVDLVHVEVHTVPLFK